MVVHFQGGMLRLIRLARPSIISMSTSSQPVFSMENNSMHRAKRGFANEDLRRKLNDEYLRAQKRILTLPNILTFSRIAVTPAIGYFICNGMNQHALACFAFAATTDLLDGLTARVLRQQSDFGALIDPIADKMLLMTCFLSLYHASLMPLWLIKGFILRDLFLLLGGGYIRYTNFKEKPKLREFIDIKGRPTIGFEPTILSKVNTALQCFLVVLHLGGLEMLDITLSEKSTYSLQLLTAVTSCLSFSQYIMRFRYSVRKPPRSKDCPN